MVYQRLKKYNRYLSEGLRGYSNLRSAYRIGKRFAGTGPRLRGTASRTARRRANAKARNDRFLRELTKRTDLGNPSATTTCKRWSNALINTSISGYELYSDPLIGAVQSASGSNTRNRNVANVRGVKLEMTVQSELLRNVGCLNVAVIIPKVPGNAAGNAISKLDFWRSPNPSGTSGYARDFDSTQSQLEYDTLAINSTGYRVLWRKKFQLMPLEQYGDLVNPESAIQIKGSGCTISEWIPVDRQMSWLNNSSTYPTNNVFVVYWMSKFSDGADGSREPEPGFATVNMRRTTFFKEPGDF